MRRLPVPVPALCFSLLAACSDPPVPSDASTAADTGTEDRDGGPLPPDGGGRDGGPASCSLPVAFDEGVAYPRTLHVATTGSASNDGSEASPLDSIESASRMATPGTRILVHAGTYTGGQYVEGLAGTAAAPIAITGEDGAILDAGGEGEVIHFSSITYVVIEHLELRNATGNGINVDDGGTEGGTHHVVLRDLAVHDIGTGGNNDCVKLSGIDDYFVLGCDLSACSAGDAIDHVGCHDGYLHGNRIHDTPAGGIQMKGGSADILVHGNWFVDVAGRAINAGGSTGLEFFRPIDAPHEAARLSIVANVFVRGGADSGAAIAYVGCDGCVFANNTVVEPRTWVARILQESTDARFVPSRNGLFVNNVVVFRGSDLRTFVNVGGGTAPETFTFANNLWYALDDPAFDGPTLTDGIPAETGSVIQMDPGITADDPDLCAGAPGAASGRAVDGLCLDLRDVPYLSPPSIGAVQAYSCP